MGFMSKLRGGSQAEPRQNEARTEPPLDCPHGTMIPRWDEAADMGKQDKISSYRCESCSQELTPAEADEVMANEVNRVRI
ncbi:MAG: hypothetical protein WD058_02845 [Dehalococcoidia bacterium]